MAKLLLAAAVFAASILISSTAAAEVQRAGCPFFPQVAWWSETSHDTVTHYVDARLDGHWSAYIARWRKELARLKGIRARGNVAVISAAGVRLQGPKLTRYIEQVERRIDVMNCLSGADLDGLETASGNPEQVMTIGRPAIYDLVSKDGVTFELGIRCRGGNAYVSVTNHGTDWEDAIVVAVLDPLTMVPSATRRLRLEDGQSISYRVLARDVVRLRVSTGAGRGRSLHNAELDCGGS